VGGWTSGQWRGWGINSIWARGTPVGVPCLRMFSTAVMLSGDRFTFRLDSQAFVRGDVNLAGDLI